MTTKLQLFLEPAIPSSKLRRSMIHRMALKNKPGIDYPRLVWYYAHKVSPRI